MHADGRETAAPGAATTAPGYVPALGFAALTRFYDPVLRATLREDAFKSALVAQARVPASGRVLDLGAGTGTLTLLVKQRTPGADVIGLDGDREVIARARAKAARASLPVRFDQGSAAALPYADRSFDRVVSSLLLHHLSPRDKRGAIAEVFRVLVPGGELHVADWGRPTSLLMRALFVGVQLLDGFATTTENVEGMLPELFREAGFTDVRETGTFATVFGTLALYRAVRPQSAPLVSTS